MATKSIDARIKHKRDSAGNWDRNNPVLLDGEIIIVDTASGEVRTKTGNGVKNYKQLPFDDEAIKAQITSLSNSIPDVSKYVIAEQPASITQTVPETFNGHTLSEFVLKTDVVNNLTSTSTNTPLSANQGKVLNDTISGMKNSVDTLNGRIPAIQTKLVDLSNMKMDKSGGALSGALVAQNNADYATKQVRNVIISTNAPTVNDGANGDIWIQYTP